MTKKVSVFEDRRPFSIRDDNVSIIEGAIDEACKFWKVPGAVVTIADISGGRYINCYGVKNLQDASPVDANTVFAIASLTKAFTATVSTILMKENLNALDSPVRTYFPQFRLSESSADHVVTIRDLLTHRVGLARNDMLWYDSPFDAQEVLKRVKFLPFINGFRSIYNYNNLMFLAAGLAIGTRANADWHELVRAHLFEKLNMARTSTSLNDVVAGGNYATPYQLGGEGQLHELQWRDLSNIAPAGAINSCGLDIANWLQCLLQGGIFNGTEVVTPEALATTFTPQVVIPFVGTTKQLNPFAVQMSYGLGWGINDFFGLRMVTHDGAIDGFRSRIAILPDVGLALSIFCNLGLRLFPEALRATLIELLLGMKPHDWNNYYLAQDQPRLFESLLGYGQESDMRTPVRTDDGPCASLKALAGVYTSLAYGQIEIALADGILEFKWNNFNCTLQRIFGNTYNIVEDNSLEHAWVGFPVNTACQIESLQFLGTTFNKRLPATRSGTVGLFKLD